MKMGDRVSTSLGPGTVAYVRMDVLVDIRRIAAVSVVLDSRKDRLGYSGTIFDVSKVENLEMDEP